MVPVFDLSLHLLAIMSFLFCCVKSFMQKVQNTTQTSDLEIFLQLLTKSPLVAIPSTLNTMF